jgi:hypothetical protein
MSKWKQTITRASGVADWLNELEREYHVHGETLAVTTLPQSLVLAVVRVSEKGGDGWISAVAYDTQTVISYDGLGGA